MLDTFGKGNENKRETYFAAKSVWSPIACDDSEYT
jgi:hypothetical protein